MGKSVYVSPEYNTTKTSHEPASNTNAVVTLDAVAGYRHAIRQLFWSYSGGVPVGRLTITDAGSTVLVFDITAAGPAPMPINMKFGSGTAVVVTLLAGGSGITGKLTVESYKVKLTS